MNCATTIDLNPVTLSPSATRPHMQIQTSERLNIYGDADVTVSDCNDKDAPAVAGSAIAGGFWTLY